MLFPGIIIFEYILLTLLLQNQRCNILNLFFNKVEYILVSLLFASFFEKNITNSNIDVANDATVNNKLLILSPIIGLTF